jgi:hypothetical protein
MAMNTRKLTLLFTALFGLAVSAFAQSTPNEATVARVTGTVTATLADGSTVAVTEGTKLPQGATITTGDKSEAYLVNHGDTTSVIASNSVVEIAELSTTSAGGKVTELKTTLDLKSGNLVAKLNPAKKSVNQYSVRTPKGVAAARGTTFTVSYKGGTFQIAVVGGLVSIEQTGGTPQNIAAGSWADSQDRVGNSMSDAAQDIRELLAVAVATVTIAAQNNIGGTTAAEAAQVAAVVFKAVPSVAEQAGAIIAQSNAAKPPADAAAAAAVLQAVTASTPAAAREAFTSGVTTGTFTPNPNTTTTNPGSNNSQGANETTTPQPIDPGTVSRSGE